MGLATRKPVYWASDQVRPNPVYSATGSYQKIAILFISCLDMILHKKNNKGAEQTVQMHRLVCALVVCKPRRQVSCIKAHMRTTVLINTRDHVISKSML